METVAALASIDYTVLVVLGHKLSLIELVGITSGLASVYWASTMNRLTWPAGLINEAAFFVTFYQVQLYSEMLLQIFYAIVTFYGWYSWKHPRREAGLPRALSTRSIYRIVCAVTLGTLGLGFVMSHIHLWEPRYFGVPAASPFQDAFTTSASVVATVLLVRKSIGTWILWISVDIVSIPLYLSRAIPFMALLYVVLLAMATRGFLNWWRMMQHEARICLR